MNHFVFYNRYQITSTDHGEKCTTKLTISRVKLSDSVEYTCGLKNSEGETTGKVKLEGVYNHSICLYVLI